MKTDKVTLNDTSLTCVIYCPPGPAALWAKIKILQNDSLNTLLWIVHDHWKWQDTEMKIQSTANEKTFCVLQFKWAVVWIEMTLKYACFIPVVSEQTQVKVKI